MTSAVAIGKLWRSPDSTPKGISRRRNCDTRAANTLARWSRSAATAVASPAIVADRLVKRFGDVEAVKEVSFEVPEGQVLGLLGPNGAGKTTAVRMLTTLSRPDSGSARVLGVDVLEDPQRVRALSGLRAVRSYR